MEYCSALKKLGCLQTTWMDLNGIMPSEKTSHRGTNAMIAFK